MSNKGDTNVSVSPPHSNDVSDVTLTPTDSSLDDVSDVSQLSDLRIFNMAANHAPAGFESDDVTLGGFKHDRMDCADVISATGTGISNDVMTSRVTLEICGEPNMHTPLGYTFSPFLNKSRKGTSRNSKVMSSSTPNLTSRWKTPEKADIRRKNPALQQGPPSKSPLLKNVTFKSPDLAKLEWMSLNNALPAQQSLPNGVKNLEMSRDSTRLDYQELTSSLLKKENGMLSENNRNHFFKPPSGAKNFFSVYTWSKRKEIGRKHPLMSYLKLQQQQQQQQSNQHMKESTFIQDVQDLKLLRVGSNDAMFERETGAGMTSQRRKHAPKTPGERSLEKGKDR